MSIPDNLITADIREASYYQEYQANVTKHRRFLVGETGIAQDSLAPKPAKPARKTKPTAQKARINILQYLIHLRMCNDFPTKMMKMFLLVENLRWQSAPASDHLKSKCTIESRAKRSFKIISLGHCSILLASSHTVKSKTDIKSPTHYPCANELTDAFGKPFKVLNNVFEHWVCNSLVHSSRALSALRRFGLRMASTAAKPCQGDSSEFYLITGSIYTDQRGTVVLATLFNGSWDASTGKLNCSDDWWEKIEEKDNVKIFRTKPPSKELQEAWDQIFWGFVASGGNETAPSMDVGITSEVPIVRCSRRRILYMFNERRGSRWQDVPSSNEIGISKQVNKSSKLTMKPKNVEMKRIGRGSSGSRMFKEFMVKQDEKQDRLIEILKSDAIGVNKDDPYSASRCMNVINDMIDESNYRLKASDRMTVVEKLGIFVYTLVLGVSNRDVSERFQRSGETISRAFHEVLEAITARSKGFHGLVHEMIKPKDPTF
nr:hypothetical protein [Tanacetum cinerariifolium]